MDHLPPDDQERVAIAAQALERNQLVLSGPKAQPMFCWSRRVMTGPEIAMLLGASGNAPFEVLAGWPLPPEMAAQVPLKPPGSEYCWLIVVRIKARNV